MEGCEGQPGARWGGPGSNPSGTQPSAHSCLQPVKQMLKTRACRLIDLKGTSVKNGTEG